MDSLPFTLTDHTRTLSTATGDCRLSPVEFQLLTYLLGHPDTLVSAETLLQEIWHYHPGTGSGDVVRFHVRKLRQKLEPNPEKPIYLINTPGYGYMLRTTDSEQKLIG